MDHHQTLQKEIALLLLETLNLEVSSAHEDLIATGLLDSLKIVQLLVELEQRLGMKVPLNDLEIDNFRTLETITNFARKIRIQGMPNVAAPAPLSRIALFQPQADEQRNG